MIPQDETALQIWQANRGDRLLCEALLDECLAPGEYIKELDLVRCAMSEGVDDMSDFDIGHLTSGIRANAADACDAWWKHGRSSEFGPQEILDIREAVLGLWTLLREIEAQKRVDHAA